MNVRPLRDRILVERLEQAEQRIGGIIIPDTAQEKPQQAKVIAIGRGRVNDDGEVFPLDVKAGDTVLLGKYSGTEITIAGKEYVSLREEEVLGVVEGVAAMAMA
jgi:chaperonin GroES